MWGEIQEKAKLQLLTLLVRIKVILAKEDTSQSLDNASLDNAPYLKPASQVVLDRWKIMIDVFIENGLLHDFPTRN